LEANPQEDQMSPFTRRIAVLAGAAVLAIGGTGVAQAKHGADDPAPHVNHGGKRADDATPHARHHHRRHHHRHGADDPAGHR
jgi:hypothetical protein